MVGELSSYEHDSSGVSAISNGPTNYLWIEYSTIQLSPGTRDEFKIKITDKVIIPDQVFWQVEIDYNDGVGFRPAKTTNLNDNRVEFVLPAPSGDSFIYPNIIFLSLTNEVNYMNYYITNTGLNANKIVRAEILIPNLYLNNVTAISSVLVNNTFITNKNDKLIISYSAGGTNISPGKGDVIAIAITNSNSDISNVLFDCHLYNPDKDKLSSTTAGQSKIVDVIERPTFKITPNNIYFSDVTNTYSFVLKNGTNNYKKDKGRDIHRLRVMISTQHYIALTADSSNHDFSVTSKNTNMSGTNYRCIEYSAIDLLTPSRFDDFNISVVDIVDSTNKVFWKADVDYNDGIGFRPAIVDFLNANKVNFVIPVSSAESYIEPNSVDYTITDSLYRYYIDNTGTPGNDIKMLEIFLPIAAFSGVSDVSNDTPANITISTPGDVRIFVDYDGQGTNLLSGNQDIVYFKAYDTINSKGPKPIVTCNVVNTVDQTFTAPTTLSNIPRKDTKSQEVEFVSIGFSGKAYISSHSPSTPIDSTTITNTIRYYIENTGEVGNYINKVRITIPTPIFSTNISILDISSIIVTNSYITRTSNTIVIDYVTNGVSIDAAEVDEISIKVMDYYDFGNTNIEWKIEANYSTSSNPNQYYDLSTPLDPELQQDTYFYTPGPAIEGWVTPYEIDNELFNVTFTYYFTNKGINGTNSGNDIRRIIIAVPDAPTVFSAIENVILSTGSIFSTSSTQIIVDYAVDEFQPGEVEWVKFDMTNKIHSYTTPSTTNGLVFNSWASNPVRFANVTVPYADPPIFHKDISIFELGLSSRGYVLEPPKGVLFTLDTNMDITYKIENNSAGGVNDVKVYVTNNNFTILTVSNIEGGIISNNSGVIKIDYGSLQSGSVDEIVFNIDYTTNITKFTLNSRLANDNITNFPRLPGLPSVLEIRKADFGRIRGKVFPTNQNINVVLLQEKEEGDYDSTKDKQVYISSNYADLYDGNKIVDSTGLKKGLYMLDFIPAGTYTVRLSLAGYRNTYINVVVSNNRYTDISNIIMRNKRLELDGLERKLLASDCSNTYVEFPINSVYKLSFVDIKKDPMTGGSPYANAILKNDSILPVGAADIPNIVKYEFVLQEATGEHTGVDVDELEINDVSINISFCYNLPLPGSWTEDSLAIYYYKENTGDWVRLGGQVNKTDRFISIQANYLHSHYAVFGSKPPEFVKSYGDLKIWPNPFTPGRGGEAYKNLKISCIFKNNVTDFKFKVYDLMGRVIFEKEYTGSYDQCEIYWDGKDDDDDDGYWVKTGVYIFQIETGSEYYRGKVGILR